MVNVSKLGRSECSQIMIVFHVFALLFGAFQHVHGVADFLVGHDVARTVPGFGQAADGGAAVAAGPPAGAAVVAGAQTHCRTLRHDAVFFGHDAVLAVGVQPVIGQDHEHGGENERHDQIARAHPAHRKHEQLLAQCRLQKILGGGVQFQLNVARANVEHDHDHARKKEAVVQPIRRIIEPSRDKMKCIHCTITTMNQ